MTRQQVFRLLCNLLSLDNSSASIGYLNTCKVANSGWEMLISLANDFLVSAAVGCALRSKGTPETMPQSIADYFEGMAFLNRQRNSCIREEAVFVANILNQNGVEPIFLKGAANLLSGLYADPAYRYMVDVDILVPQESLDHCIAAMLREGYQPLATPDAFAHHYAPLGRANSMVSVELHVEPLDTAYGAFLRSTDIMNSAIPLDISGISASIPRPWCRIVHSIVHAELVDHGLIFGTIAIRELLDVALLARTLDGLSDLPPIRKTFQRRGRIACGFHLLAATKLFGAKFGETVYIDHRSSLFYYRALWQATHPRFAKVVRRLCRPWLLLVRSLSHPKLRRRLLRCLIQSDWYRRQWIMLRHDSS
jgi:hypothetical protein